MIQYYNFYNRKNIPCYTPPNPNLSTYAALLARYLYLKTGLDFLDLVPNKLFLSFSNFGKKYNLGGFINFVIGFSQEVGNILKLPTI